MEDIHLSIASMGSTVQEILSQVDSMPKDCIHWKPGPEVWTVMDNLCHISEFVPYWTAQIEQVIHYPDKQWGRTHHDPDRLAAVADTSSRDLRTVKEQIRSGVASSASTLERFTPDQFAIEAPSRNPKWGLKPASFIVDTLLVAHLKSHLSQIRRNLAQFEAQQHPGGVLR
ncbi:MAG: DinB family protein [Bryobacteraceae bacterium]